MGLFGKSMAMLVPDPASSVSPASPTKHSAPHSPHPMGGPPRRCWLAGTDRTLLCPGDVVSRWPPSCSASGAPASPSGISGRQPGLEHWHQRCSVPIRPCVLTVCQRSPGSHCREEERLHDCCGVWAWRAREVNTLEQLREKAEEGPPPSRKLYPPRDAPGAALERGGDDAGLGGFKAGCAEHALIALTAAASFGLPTLNHLQPVGRPGCLGQCAGLGAAPRCLSWSPLPTQETTGSSKCRSLWTRKGGVGSVLTALCGKNCANWKAGGPGRLLGRTEREPVFGCTTSTSWPRNASGNFGDEQ